MYSLLLMPHYSAASYGELDPKRLNELLGEIKHVQIAEVFVRTAVGIYPSADTPRAQSGPPEPLHDSSAKYKVPPEDEGEKNKADEAHKQVVDGSGIQNPMGAPSSRPSRGGGSDPKQPSRWPITQWWRNRGRKTQVFLWSLLGAGVGLGGFFLQRYLTRSPSDVVLRLETPLATRTDTGALRPLLAILDAGATGLPETLVANTVLTFRSISDEGAIQLGGLSAEVMAYVDVDDSSVFGIRLTGDTPLQAVAEQLAVDIDNTLPVAAHGSVTLSDITLGDGKVVVIEGPDGSGSIPVPFVSVNDVPTAVMSTSSAVVGSTNTAIQPFNTLTLQATDPDVTDATRLAVIPTMQSEGAALPWRSSLPEMALENIKFVRINGDGVVEREVGTAPFADGTTLDSMISDAVRHGRPKAEADSPR